MLLNYIVLHACNSNFFVFVFTYSGFMCYDKLISIAYMNKVLVVKPIL